MQRQTGCTWAASLLLFLAGSAGAGDENYRVYKSARERVDHMTLIAVVTVVGHEESPLKEAGWTRVSLDLRVDEVLHGKAPSGPLKVWYRRHTSVPQVWSPGSQGAAFLRETDGEWWFDEAPRQARTRQAALDILADAGAEAAAAEAREVEVPLPALEDAQTETGRACRRWLSAGAGEVRQRILKMAVSMTPAERAWAAVMLAQVDPEERDWAIPALYHLVGDPDRVKTLRAEGAREEPIADLAREALASFPGQRWRVQSLIARLEGPRHASAPGWLDVERIAVGLRELTGKDLGASASDWRAWWSASPPAGDPPPPGCDPRLIPYIQEMDLIGAFDVGGVQETSLPQSPRGEQRAVYRIQLSPREVVKGDVDGEVALVIEHNWGGECGTEHPVPLLGPRQGNEWPNKVTSAFLFLRETKEGYTLAEPHPQLTSPAMLPADSQRAVVSAYVSLFPSLSTLEEATRLDPPSPSGGQAPSPLQHAYAALSQSPYRSAFFLSLSRGPEAAARAWAARGLGLDAPRGDLLATLLCLAQDEAALEAEDGRTTVGEVARASMPNGLGVAWKLDALLRHLQSGPEGDREAAVRALQGLTGRGFGADTAEWTEWWLGKRDPGE